MYKKQLKKISDVEYELPKTGKMNVPGKLFLSETLLDDVEEDAIKQVANVALLPGILGHSIGLSDMHTGYGFSIGGVAAFDPETGVISPGGVGYDINCSVRLLRTNLKLADLKGKEKEILHSLFRTVPSGVGRGGRLKVDRGELDNVLVGGAQWAVEKGYGKKADYLHMEEQGKLPGADPSVVSQRAKSRGMPQLGSLGAGNHFLDVLVVDELFDEKIAKVFGLKKGQIVIMVHCGSRGLGHQVASDYIKLMDQEYGHPDVDRELVNAPIKSELGKKYMGAMASAANFAFANKQIITHWIREDMKHYFPKFKAEVVYDVCHNIAKFEKHKVDGKMKEVLIMRKGATRSFGPGRKEIPEDYREVGQPVFIPGSMGTASYVLCGTKKAEEISFGSTAHGAGRVKSRTQAKRDMTFEEAQADMEKRGVFVESGGQKGMVEESPFSYKDIDEVVKVSHEAGIGKMVAKLMPVLVVIG
ncbi:RtcB family protein [archaeon]|jgi:tRNA-splicing ligase RtcB (3'-phosphate/5'-hydroxy nucleic acid ligase)|nr:RtcB family protein [archaeon]MBT3577842.1 RtcB family protein [archaeon]MBT6820193.1 RtcB family protein [archaeon]MBT6955776.1 RtcB family protein [archaeon]MBT7025304.1 RtcB family protein [archaeon]